MSLKEIRDPGSQPQKHRWFPDSLPTIHSLIRDLKWYSTIQSRVWISIGYPKTALTLAGAKEVHPRKQCPNDLQFRWSNGPNARPTEFVVPCNYEKMIHFIHLYHFCGISSALFIHLWCSLDDCKDSTPFCPLVQDLIFPPTHCLVAVFIQLIPPFRQISSNLIEVLLVLCPIISRWKLFLSFWFKS